MAGNAPKDVSTLAGKNSENSGATNKCVARGGPSAAPTPARRYLGFGMGRQRGGALGRAASRSVVTFWRQNAWGLGGAG